MDTSRSALITASDLAVIADHAVIIDASWHMPTSQRHAQAEYNAEHIAGAYFFDLDAESDKSSSLPHMLPKIEDFQRVVRSFGIDSDSQVVVYDTHGLFSAARLWWMLRVFGHDNVFILDGGLPAWKRFGGAVNSEIPALADGNFEASLRPSLYVSFNDMQRIVKEKSHYICDARSAGRFSGHEPEPRAGVRSGHIPHSHNIYYASLLKEDGTLHSKEVLRRIFSESGVSQNKPVVTTCGSGITACILALAQYELGFVDVAVYDGSWAEWGASTQPVAVTH